jgi:hypothetical protein
MPGHGKGKARGQSGGPPDPLEWRIKYLVDPALIKKHGAAKLRKMALEYYQENGEEMPGVHMIGEWRNPLSHNEDHANWKNSDDEDGGLDGFFETIHGAMTAALALDPSEVKVHGQKTRPKKPAPVKVYKDLIDQSIRRQAMQTYHAALRKIRDKHPSWRIERAREQYRADRDRAKESKRKKQPIGKQMAQIVRKRRRQNGT